MLIPRTLSSLLLFRLQPLPAMFLLSTACIYFCGFVLAYFAFLVDRKEAIRAVQDSVSAESRGSAFLRSPQTTWSDRAQALIAAAIWPALLVATLVSSVWLATRRSHERGPTATLQRAGRFGSLTTTGNLL